MFLFNMVLYVLRLLLVISYYVELGSDIISRLYSLSRYPVDINSPCVTYDFHVGKCY